MSTRPFLELTDLCVSIGGISVLRGVNLMVARGEAVGIVGESGSGKSVTWLAALGLLGRKARVAGRVRLQGEDILHMPAPFLDRVRGARIAMIFQDPASSLNPVHKVGDQVSEVLRLHRGMDRRAARAEARRLFDAVGISDAGRRLDAYPHELSGGQNQRVMIAAALAGEPDLLVADEPTTALDVTIQAQILDLLREVRTETGMGLVIISHDLGIIAETCSRVAVMYAGRVVEEAPVDDLLERPIHPYTAALLAALPNVDGPRRRVTAIPGSVPDLVRLPPGCPFGPRCRRHTSACDAAEPALASVDAEHPGRRAACFHSSFAHARAPEHKEVVLA
ncbi:ABC transporter ATP-binding protein [Mesorhizobium atlanticum]|uniref:ABC transporter ATP-binding protein n=1 Tax=Mesorhizobium atlanticum TaxID=2233532 RepID=A0A330GU37_9HYPH|nr:ABC transporter ATP-binding protein [Mesorhizobium atlanticum]RAZ72909.1 ABC transporter ATP-binding protein [Mesorhizobium atlanticum]